MGLWRGMGKRLGLMMWVISLTGGCPIDRLSEDTPMDVSPEATVFQTYSLPKDKAANGVDFRYMASVGNGHLATVVYSDTIYVNGLYNGVMGWSHRARIPSTQAIRVGVAGKLHCNITRKYSLDVSRGLFEEVLDVDNMQGRVTQRTYAHQHYTRLLVTEILVERQSAEGEPFVVLIHNNPGNDTTDIDFSEKMDYENEFWPSYELSGRTIESELNRTDDFQDVYMFSTKLPETLTLSPKQKKWRWYFFTSIDLNHTVAQMEFQNALEVQQLAPNYIYKSHVEAWEAKWKKGRIEVSGNTKIQKLIYGSFYYLLSFLPSTEPKFPANQFYGLSPGGLANGANWTDYQGHVFWDMETWMYPTMLMFHPELAKEMLSYRIQGMEFARARALDGGYQGLRYPWESARTGVEVTPDICIPCRENQQHITGDIALAARQYLTATRDVDWLKSEKGYQLIKDIGLFWASRPTFDAGSNAYDINGVMPPDEHAVEVNNSVYTNVLAAKSIRFARYAACLNDLDFLGEIDDSLISIADRISIPFNKASRFHPEFEGFEDYNNGTHVVKQADVILLGYPLMYEMASDIRRNDLELYENITDEGGPAMTWGMFAIGWLELGEEDRAAQLFEKAHAPYTREPFKIWTEARSGIGAVNFLTGMGGFLQTIFFGYGGARLHVERLTFDPRLPPGTDGMKFVDVNYLGSRFDIHIKQHRVQINVTETVVGSELILTVTASGTQFLLTKDRLIDLAREAFYLEGSEVSDCPLPEGTSCPPGTPRSVLTANSPVVTNARALGRPVEYMVLTHTQGSSCHTMEGCKEEARRYVDSYNYIIGEDGQVYEGVGVQSTSEITSQFGITAITVAFLGDFKCRSPNTKALAAVSRLGKCLIESGLITRNYMLVTLEQASDSGVSEQTDDAIFCTIKSWKHWNSQQAVGALRDPDCDRLCYEEIDYTVQSDGLTDLSEEPYIFQTDRLPVRVGTQEVDPSYMPSVGNGHIATVVYSPSVYMNGLFSGYAGESHRARMASWHNVRTTIVGATPDKELQSYTLNVKKGVFEEKKTTPNVTVSVRTYAHQHYTQLLVTEVKVERSKGIVGNITVQLENIQSNEASDLEVGERQQYYENEERLWEGCYWIRGVTKQPEWNTSKPQEVYMYWKEMQTELILTEDKESDTWIHITSIDSDQKKARTVFQSGLWRIGDGDERLFNSHVKAWWQKWDQGIVEIEGNTHLAKLAYSSQYYLLSSLPSEDPNHPNEQFYGVSSDTLARGGSGHVTWHMELLVFPSVALFHPDLAKDMLSYRIHTAGQAYQRDDGNEMWFPWESGLTGVDVTPEDSGCYTCSETTKHVSGDIGFAAHQYVSLTRDTEWLKEKGYKLVKDLAGYWIKQLVWDSQKQAYVIPGVTPVDKLVGNVNNSVYTNYLAKLNIHLGRYAACLKGRNYKKDVTDQWIEMADNIYFPFDSTEMVNLPYDGFSAFGPASVKFPDVIMLDYPLMMWQNKSILRNNLEKYWGLSQAHAPFMAWAMFAINWLKLGELQQAEQAFNNTYVNFNSQPFKVWKTGPSDYSGGNSIEMMSSFLQTLIFGYGGVRIASAYLAFDPKLPMDTTSLKLKGINYLGNSLDVEIMEAKVRVINRKMSMSPLYVLKYLDSMVEFATELKEGVEVLLPREMFFISSSDITECPSPAESACMPVVQRSDWGAMKAGQSPVSVVRPAVRVIVYQTAGRRCTDRTACTEEVRWLQMKHMREDKLEDISYNFLIGEDGRIYEGRGWDTLAHFHSGSAIDSLAIGIMGDFTCDFTSDLAIGTLKDLINCGIESGHIHWNYTLLGERQVDNIHNLVTREDRLLCQLSHFVHWEPLQYGGMFLKPKCDDKCERPFVIPESTFQDISDEPTVFKTDKLPTLKDSDELDYKSMASVGNGHLSAVVYGPTVYVNGLYNGPTGWSHRARIPALNAVRVNFTDVPERYNKRWYALDVEKAVFEEKVMSTRAHMLQRTYAHQFYTRLLVTEIHVMRRPGARGDVNFNLHFNTGGPSEDIIFDEIRNVTDNEIKECDCLYHHGRTNESETDMTPLEDVHLYWNRRPEMLTLTSDLEHNSWIFITAIDQKRGVAQESMKAGIDLISRNSQDLFKKHVEAWKQRWDRGRIEVDGDLVLSKRIYGSFYYLLSFLPAFDPYITANQFYGLSPGGLANGANWTDYQGHVFWDMETWMYPTMLMFHPELAKEMLSYRIHGMKYAELRAKEGNYSGLRFPWESAFTGYEQTPDICVPCRENQLHITGDIGLAARQYLTMTRDLEWLREQKGYAFIHGMADFWRSRPTWNQTKQAYDINGVMPPDEHAQSINNSVYTNVGAKLSIHYARYAACLSGMNASAEVPDEWLEVADKLHLPFNSKKQYHPEFEGFEEWTDERGVKQADVILLGYPQMWPMSPEVRRNDLEIYEKVTNPLGPAMTWGMYAIGWLELGDEERARELFWRSYALYVREPFKIWTEVKSGLGTVNFITGMGGFLQTVFFGYGGARIHVEHLSFNPRVPPGTNALRFVGVDYLDSSFDMEITDARVRILPTKISKEYPLIVRMTASRAEYRFVKDKELLLPRKPFTLRTSKVTDCPVPEGSSCPLIIEQSDWNPNPPLLTAMSRTEPAHLIIVYHSTFHRCFNYGDCKEQAKLLKENHLELGLTEVGFSFLVGEDGSVFEARGWDKPLPDFLQDRRMAIGIGILGDFSCSKPDEKSKEAVQRLIKCGVERKKIHPNYKVITFDQLGRTPISADQLYCDVKTWPHWDDNEAPGAMMSEIDCDAPCDPTAPRYLEGEVKDMSSKPTVFMTHSLPKQPGTDAIDFRYMASVGNGHLATNVYSDTVYVNGLYNGPKGWTHRARIPSFVAMRLHPQGQNKESAKSTFSLDVEKAVFEEKLMTEEVKVKQRTYAHQYYNRLLVTEILITRLGESDTDVVFNREINQGNDSVDIVFETPENYNRPEICPDGCTLMDGQTLIPETDTSPLHKITVVYKNIPTQLTLPAGVREKRWVFAMSADQNRITAEQTFDDALRQWKADPDYLYNTHVKAWWVKWHKGRIEVDGNIRLSKLIYGSFYYLMSFLPSQHSFIPNNQFYGLSPGGLANGANWTDYQGHVFWDMETWMYPTMLMFHPELAKEMLAYRIYSMGPSMKRAQNGGYSGLRYPWEAAFTGGEVTPDICIPCRENQQHITGDVAFAARQYLTATRDLHWLESEKGYEFIKGMAEFWKTRPEWNEETGFYDINGVMPPDEHQISINNSVYTNIGAKLSMYFARYAACLAGMKATEEINDDWFEVAKKIFVPFDEKHQYHPEFQGYGGVTGEKKIVKQADVILAGFPQMWPMPAHVRRNDLEIYEKVTHPGGPAMTWGMFSIGWLELGNEHKAAETFHRSYSLYTREPFKIWTEARSGIGAVNFITGMGGFLQAVFFGYGGARLHVEQLDFNPRLLPGSSAMRFIGLDYLGNSLDVEIKTDSVRVICRRESRMHSLMLESKESGVRYHLKQEKEVKFSREPFMIRAVDVTECPLPEGGSCPKIIWRTESPSSTPTTGPVFDTVVVHQTGGKRCHDLSHCQMAASSNQTYAGFHFIIGDDGRVYEGEGWNIKPDQTLKIGFIGEFTCEEPSELAIAAAKNLIKCKVEMNMLDYDYKLLTLRQTKAPDCHTEFCPADRLDCLLMTWKAWVNEQVDGTLQKPDCHGACYVPDPISSETEQLYTDISDKPTLFQTKQLPMDSKAGKIDFSYMASVSNGHLATVVFSDTIYVNGLYNGEMGWSHRARIPSPNAVRVDSVLGEDSERLKRLYTLDVEKAVFEETIDSPNLLISDRIYAHQIYTRILVTEITVRRKPAAPGAYTLNLSDNQGNASIDLKILEERNYRGNDNSIIYMHGKTLVPEIKNMSTSDVHMIYTRPPQQLTLKEGEDSKTVFILTSVGLDLTKVVENFDHVESLSQASPETIYNSHVSAWKERWRDGHIEIEGNLKLSKLVYGSFYYLLSFLPSNSPFSPSQPFNGLSPGGLANGANWTDYQGHVFWDMETWMYPTMLMFHPELAKEMLSYRIRGMQYAYDRAKSGGNEGLRFPWEAAQTGIEVTPDICVPCRENQLHITGDIAMAAKQYMSVTKDLNWLKSEKGYTLIKDIAKFWKSRPTWNDTKQEYEIKGVMPPDEHAQNVSNSVYTNVQAQLSIYFARYMACINKMDARKEVGDDWLRVADNLHIPFDETRMFHPEYEGYEEGLDIRGVKQADTILLGFPLMYRMNKEVRRNDLLHYERVTNAFGPAMTWGMFAIGWLELGDMNKAAELFTKSYQLYTKEPFKIWTEARSGIGAVNFITGMGGFLQAVYFGYAGVRIYNEYLTFNPTLPPKTSGLRLMGMNYLGNTLDVMISHDTVSVTVTKMAVGDPLVLLVPSTQAMYDLDLDVEVIIQRQNFIIASYSVSDCPYPQDPTCPAPIGRREWSSSMIEDGNKLGHPVGNVIVYQVPGVHCYSKESCRRAVLSQQSSKGHVKYNFYVGEDGSIFEGRGWNVAGDHSENFNSRSIAIGLLGDFTKSAPNHRGMANVKVLIKCGMELGKINETYNLLGEKQIKASSCDTCPADKLLCQLMKSQRWVNYQEGGTFKAPCCKDVCGPVVPVKKPTENPKPTSSSPPCISLANSLILLTVLVTRSLFL